MKNEQILFYTAKILIYEDFDNYNKELIFFNNGKYSDIRTVFIKDKMIFDMETGDIIYPLNMENNYIIGPIYENIEYVYLLQEKENYTKKDLINANNIFQLYLLKKDLVAKKKIIQFPQRRLI